MPSRRSKKAVNVSLDAQLLAEAKEFGTNLSALLEAAVIEQHREKRNAKWKKENQAAIDGWNNLIDEDGLWIEKYRAKS